MPNGSRVRSNNVFGLVADNPLASASTTLNSAGLTNLSSISGTQHAIITLDPLRVNGAPEIVIVTGHTTLSAVVTITRGAYGTTSRTHPQGTLWTHTPVVEDFIPIVTSTTRPSDPYNGEIIYETDTKAYKARESVGAAWEDVINPIGPWSIWVPSLTQSVTVSKTVIRATYIKIGRMVTAHFNLAITSAGTSGNSIVVGNLPLAAVNLGCLIGAFRYFRTGVTIYAGTTEGVTTTSVAFDTTLNGSPAGISPAFATANGDVLQATITYESAT